MCPYCECVHKIERVAPLGQEPMNSVQSVPSAKVLPQRLLPLVLAVRWAITTEKLPVDLVSVPEIPLLLDAAAREPVTVSPDFVLLKLVLPEHASSDPFGEILGATIANLLCLDAK